MYANFIHQFHNIKWDKVIKLIFFIIANCFCNFIFIKSWAPFIFFLQNFNFVFLFSVSLCRLLFKLIIVYCSISHIILENFIKCLLNFAHFSSVQWVKFFWQFSLWPLPKFCSKVQKIFWTQPFCLDQISFLFILFMIGIFGSAQISQICTCIILFFQCTSTSALTLPTLFPSILHSPELQPLEPGRSRPLRSSAAAPSGV